MLVLAAAILLQAASAGLVPQTVNVAVTDRAGLPVKDLAPDQVALLENGVVRDIVGMTPDPRSLLVAIVVDTSQELEPVFRLHLTDAVTALVRALPEGARYALWTTGDRPRRIVDVTDDRGQAAALKRVAPSGGNTLLDALVEVTKELRQKREGERLAVVVVTGRTTEFSSRDRYRVVEESGKRADLFLFLAIDEGQASVENRLSYDYVMGELTKNPGGRLERELSAMGATRVLEGFARDLTAPWRLTYETLPALKRRKIEVQVSRSDLTVRVLPGR